MQLPEGYILIKNTEFELLLSTIVSLELMIKELEGQKNKDSHNSHIPPSKDIVKVKNSRKPTGKKQGGQFGHQGKTLELVLVPDKIEKHKIKFCKLCSADLSNAKVTGYEKRQVFDIPKILMEITEHQAELKVCSCGCRNKASFPASVKAPVQYGLNTQSLCVNLSNYQFLSYDRISELMEDLTGYRINESTINTQNANLYSRLEIFETTVKDQLINSVVSHHDETGIYSEGKRIWLHSSSTPNLTHYAVDANRGKAATDRINILAKKTGTIVHDNWATYFMYSNCSHALCNAHHLRELTWFEEEQDAMWARALKNCLIQAKKQVEQAQLEGLTQLSEVKISVIEKEYLQIITNEIKATCVPEPNVKPRGKPKKTKQLNFLNRCVNHKDSVLAFVHNFDVPFDNNLAERDIRMIKVKQKVSGTFRSLSGAIHFARIRAYISTVKKNNKNVFQEIKNALEGNPFIYTT